MATPSTSVLKNFVEIPIEKLVKAPWNYKQEDADLQAKLVHNIKKNGQIENIIVRELKGDKFEVVNGNHRLDAMTQLKTKKVVAYNLGQIPIHDAKRIAVVTNESRFETDSVKLAELMSELQKKFPVDELAQEMPWNSDQIANMGQLTNFDWNEPAPNNGNGEEPGGLVNEGGVGFLTVKLRLPEEVAEAFMAQVNRFKTALHPEKQDSTLVSPVEAIQAITKHLGKISNKNLV